MKNWKTQYQQKLCSAHDAMDLVRSGDNIVASHASVRPDELLDALIDRIDAFRDLRLFHIIAAQDAPYCAPGLEDHIRFTSIFLSGPVRAAVNEGRGDYIPLNFSQAPWLFRTGYKPDIVFVQVAPPDENGNLNLGPCCDCMPAALDAADRVIALVNDHIPRTFGETVLPLHRVDRIVETSRPLPEVPPAPVGPLELKIGELCASMIKDGDTLQIGIGAIPDAVLSFLGNRKDLNIHSEMISDGVAALMKSGAVNNRTKPIDNGKTVATFVMGTQKLYDFIHNNPDIELRPVDYTNSVAVMAQIPNLVSINSCIEVDLTGQVCSETIGSYQYSGVGGQVDFVRGTAGSPGGRSILAMPSTAKNGSISRIVVELAPGAKVTTSRNDVQFIVTEYGIADLRGKTLAERARALIQIAHPDFRPSLIPVFEQRFFQTF